MWKRYEKIFNAYSSKRPIWVFTTWWTLYLLGFQRAPHEALVQKQVAVIHLQVSEKSYLHKLWQGPWGRDKEHCQYLVMPIKVFSINIPHRKKKLKLKKKETNFVTHLKLLNLQNVGKKCTRLQTFLSSVSSSPLISNLLNLLKLLGFGKQFHLQWVHEFSVEWRTNEQCQQDLQLTGTRWGLTQYFQVMRHHVAFLSLVWLPGSSAKVRRIIIYN